MQPPTPLKTPHQPPPPPPLPVLGRLGPERLEHLLVGLLVLGLRVAGLAAEHELRVELPRRGDPPRLGDLGVDERVVVLEVGAGALDRERCPEVGFLCGFVSRCYLSRQGLGMGPRVRLTSMPAA